LAACVDPTLTGGTAAPAAPAVKTSDLPKEPALIAGVYSSKSDTQFTVPEVPVDKVPTDFQRQTVAYETDQPLGTIIINPTAKHLYLVTGKGKAVRYGISVGKDGFQWSGEALITGRKQWPTWTPPKEMIARKPELEKWKDGQPGGLDNPLGARALYLTTNGIDYGYRIHGTPEWSSIGRNASSGCIRMINQDVMDLFERVPDGTKVIVLNADGSMPKGLTLPPPAPVPVVKKKAPVAPKPAAPAIIVPKPAVMPVPVITNISAATPAPAADTPPATPVVTPTVTVPAVTAPAAKPAVVQCSVPLVNGLCPLTGQAPKTTP
jgi:lipoprotein-anchoring transpeptidase ErfK/SrfK